MCTYKISKVGFLSFLVIISMHLQKYFIAEEYVGKIFKVH